MKPGLIIGLIFILLVGGGLLFLSSLAERSAPEPTEIRVPVTMGEANGGS